METVKLENPTIQVEHTDGKTYELADPIEFVLSLVAADLLDAGGKPKGDSWTVTKLRDATQKAFGFPSLTYPQMLQILESILAFAEQFQKKTPSNQTSPNATGSSPRKMPGS